MVPFKDFIQNRGLEFVILTQIIIVLCNLYLIIPQFQSRLLTISFLDVGQGDSFLISTPDGYDLLVDAGKGSSGLSELSQNFDKKEILDGVMLSHPDGDHVGRMADIIIEYDVPTVFMHQPEHDNPDYQDLLSLLEGGSEYNVISPDIGSAYKLGCCVAIVFLWPNSELVLDAEMGSKQDSDINSNSLSFLLMYKDFTMFAGGDIGVEQEDKLAPFIYDLAAGDLEVHKISHHGSNSSSSEEFLGQISPKISVIQVGQNSYGHPTNEVIENIRNSQSQIYRNDQDGMVVVSTDGINFKVERENEN